MPYSPRRPPPPIERARESPVKILLISQYFPPDPDSSRGLPFAKWLRRQGHEVRVLTAFPHYAAKSARGRQRWWKWDEVDGVPVLRVPLYRVHDRSAWRRFLNYASFAVSAATLGLASSGRCDVVYVMSTPPTVALPARLARMLWRSPYAVNVVDIWPEAVLDSGMLRHPRVLALTRRLLQGLCRFVYAHADAVTTISAGYSEMLLEQEFVSADRLHVVYNAAPQAALEPPLPAEPGWEESLGLAGRFVCLYAGNLGAYQGVETIVAAAPYLADLPQVQIAIAGNGIQEATLRRQAKELDARNLNFLGLVPPERMPGLYARADVLLIHLRDLPFLRATVPGKTQISLAAGRPIVIAARGESAHLIGQAGAGLVCAPEDPRALAEAIRTMVQLPAAQRQAMGEQGRLYYHEHMAIEVTAPRLEQILMDCVQRAAWRPA